MPRQVSFKYQAHPKQVLIHQSPVRFRTVVAGRRGGKTKVAISETCFHALTVPNSRLWYVSPTYRQSKTVAWKMFLEMLPPETIEKKNEQDLEIKLTNGSEISLKGTERPDTLRGVGLDGVVLDEVAFMKEGVWETIIRPMLIDSKGWALFIGTPAGYNYFWKLAKIGDHENEIEGDAIEILGEDDAKTLKLDPEWKTFRFTTYDNPYIPPGEIQAAKEITNEDYFAQEYLARFTRFTGLVYKEFDPAIHIISPIDIPPNWLRGVGVDIGYTAPSAAVFLALDEKGNIYVYDELYQKEVTSSEFVEMLKPRIADRFYQIKVADPAAADFIARARQEGLWFTSPERPEGSRIYGWVGETINWVKDYLKVNEKTNKPKLFIFNTCKNTSREFQTYVWDEMKFSSKDHRPKKENDHAMDALRYAIMELKGRKTDLKNYDQEGKPLVRDTDLSKKDWNVAAI